MSMEGEQTTPDVVEDVFEGRATCVEVEDPGEDRSFKNFKCFGRILGGVFTDHLS